MAADIFGDFNILPFGIIDSGRRTEKEVRHDEEMALD
jgi:hypothetical protein